MKGYEKQRFIKSLDQAEQDIVHFAKLYQYSEKEEYKKFYKIFRKLKSETVNKLKKGDYKGN